MRYIFFVGLFWFLSLSAQAQTITVRNFLNPDAPVARDSFALIEGENFTDEETGDPVRPPTTMGGITVMIDGVPQPIRSVSPTSVVILVRGAGSAARTLELQTKFSVIHRTLIYVASVWPSLPVQSTGDDAEALYPAGYWTTDPTGIQKTALNSLPISVGPRARPTLVAIQVSGLRRGMTTHGISVRLNGIQCPVVGIGPSVLAGQNELFFQIPSFLANNGVMDLIVTVDNRSSNPARLNLGVAVGLTGN